MATLYASGSTWNTASNWGTTSGASDGTVPTGSDDLIFDANSVSMTIDVNAVCNTIDTTGYTATLTQGTYTITTTDSVIWAAGTFAGGSGKITIGHDFTQTGGTFTNTSDTMDFTSGSSPEINVTAGTYNHNNGTIEGSGNHLIMDMNGAEVYSCRSNFGNASTTWRFYSGTVINGDFIQDKGTFADDNQTIDLHGDFKCGNTQTQTASILFKLVGTGDQDIYYDKIGGAGKSGAGVSVDKPSGTATFYDNIRFYMDNGTMLLEWTQGTVVWDSTSIIWDSGFASNVDWDGGERIRSYKVLKSNQGLGTTLLSNLEVIDFWNDGMGPLNGFTLDITGDILQDNDMTGTTNIELTGTGDQDVDTGGVAFGGGTFTINKASGTVQLVGNFDNSISGSDVIVDSGTFDFNGYDFSVDDKLTISGGTVLGGSGTIDVDGDILMSSGTFTNTSGTCEADGDVTISGGTYNHNNGLVKVTNITTFDIGSSILYDLQLSGASGDIFTITGTVDVDGTFTKSGGTTIAGGILLLGGNSVWNDTGVGGSGLVEFDGSGTQTVSGVANGEIMPMKFSHSGTVDFTADLDIAGTRLSLIEYVSGTVDFTGTTLKIIGGSGLEHTIDAGPIAFDNIIINTLSGSNITVTGTFDIDGDLTTDGIKNISGGAVTVAGDINLVDSDIAGTTTLTWDGSTAKNLDTNAGAGDWNGTGITVDGTGTLSLTSNLSLDKSGSGLVIDGGTFDMNGFDVDVDSDITANGGTFLGGAGSITVGADFVVAGCAFTSTSGTLSVVGLAFTVSSGSFTHNSGNVEIAGNTTITIASDDFYDLTIDNNSSTTMGSSITVVNDFLMESTNLWGGGFILYVGRHFTWNDVTVGVTFNQVKFNGTGDQVITTVAGADLPTGFWEVNKPSGKVSLASNLDLNLSTRDFIITSGIFDLAGYNFTLVGDLIVNDSLKLKGSETITTTSTTINTSTSTIIYYDDGVTAVVTDLATSFYNLTFGASKVHEFSHGVGNGISVAGCLDSDGGLATQAILRSVADAAIEWELNLSGTSALGSGVDVKYSDASAGLLVSACGSTDSGNNTNWCLAAPGGGSAAFFMIFNKRRR